MVSAWRIGTLSALLVVSQCLQGTDLPHSRKISCSSRNYSSSSPSLALHSDFSGASAILLKIRCLLPCELPCGMTHLGLAHPMGHPSVCSEARAGRQGMLCRASQIALDALHSGS